MHILRYLIVLTVFLVLAACLESNQLKPMEAIELENSAAQETKNFVQLGHSQTVNAVAFSPDGQFVLSGSDDNMLKLWDSKSGREIRTFQGHSDHVTAVALSPDGKLALSGSKDGSIKLWENKTGREIRTFQGRSAEFFGFNKGVLAVEFSPDGKLALSADKKIKLWNVKSGREIHTYEGHSKVNAVAFSSDGKLALSGGLDKKLKLWDTKSGREIRTFKGQHYEGVYAVALSHDGKLALSGGGPLRGELKLWDVKSGHEIRNFKGDFKQVKVVAFSPDGKLALSGGYNISQLRGELKLWDVKTGREIRNFQGDFDEINSVAFSPDGKFALSGSFQRFNMWDIKTGREIHTFQGYSRWVNAVVFSPDGKLVLSGSGDKTLNLWQVKSGRKIRSFKGHSKQVTAVAFSPDGKLILSGAGSQLEQGEVKLWEVKSGREIRNFKVHSTGVDAVAFSLDSKLALSVYLDKTLKLWDIKSGHEVRSFQGNLDDGFINAVFSPDRKLVLSGGLNLFGELNIFPMDEYKLKLWEVNSGRDVRIFQGNSDNINAVAFSPDSKFALSGGDKTLKLWNVKSGREIHTFQGHSGFVKAVAFSPNGKLALSGSNDHTLKLWDIKTGHNIRTFQGHFDSVDTVAFSPDGKLALSGSHDSTVRLWNVETGEEVAKMVNFIDGEWITITPEGYYMASLNGDKYLNVRVGNQIYGIDQYEAIYHRPDIVKLALEIGDSQKAIAQTIRRATQFAEVQPPKIWFIYPQNGYETERSSIEVQVNTQNIVDTAETISFTVNQRPVATEKGKRVLPTSKNVKTYTKKIPLQVGENKIQAIVRGTAGAVQRTSSLLVLRKGVKKKLPKLYYLGIGVAQHSQMPLKYPVKDVKGLETVLKQQQGKAYQRVITKTLTNQEATRGNIINTITTFFKPVKLGDIAILFISGHGMNTDLGYHFLTSDADPDKLESTGASWEIFNAINKLKAHVLLLADTCHAGNIVGNTDWQARAKVDPSQFLREANLHNVIVLASSSGDGVSQEDSSWGHGAFTKALIEGLAGKAAYKKGVVKLSYLQDYVRERVPELTDNSQQPTIPRMTGSGEFLELVLAIK